MSKRSTIGVCLILMAMGIITLTGLGQIPSKVEHYSTEDGLSHDIITCMFKDHEGFMWFGTWDGINRFDGHNFKTYKSFPGDLSPLKSNRIDQVTEDDFGHLWLKGYDGQVYRFDKATEKFTPLSSLLNIKSKINFDRILSTADDMLWLSTTDQGILVVNGIHDLAQGYQVYNKEAPARNRLPSNKVNVFFRDGAFTWIGTDKGLVCVQRLAQGNFEVRSPGLALKDNVTAVAADANRLYFGTVLGKLLVFDKKTQTLIKDIILSPGQLNGILPAKNGVQVYLTTSLGELITLENKTFRASRSTLIPASPLHSMYEDHRGDLWIEPDKFGVVRFDPAKRSFSVYTQRTDAQFNNPGNHFKVFEDRNGITWCVLRDGGFGYYDTSAGKLQYFYNKPGAREHRFSNIVTVTFYDPAGVLWMHTDERGLEKVIFDPNEFTQHLLVDPGLFKSDNEVRSLLNDAQNRLWVGVKSGKLYLFKDGHELKNIFVNEPSEGVGSVYAILQDKKGRIWLGTKANGLYRADPVDAGARQYRLTHFQHDPRKPNTVCSDEIYSLVEDREGRVWIGTFDNGLGLYAENNGAVVFRHIDESYGYPHRFYKIRHMSLDNSGRMWLGTTDGLVIASLQGKDHFAFTTYSKQPGDLSSLGNNDIEYVYRDSKGLMWLATSGGGLNLAVGNNPEKGLTFQAYTTRNGLANDYVLSCTEDRNHDIWVATKSSLSRFNVATARFKNYNSYDGVPNTTFSEATCQRLTGGNLVFGTIHGFFTFDPGQLHDFPIYANMVFTDLQVNNSDVEPERIPAILSKNIDNTASIELKYNQNIFSIDYAVLDYRSGNRQFYQHRLSGFDTTWHDNKNQRRATYTNLPPGHYVFEVRCIDSERYLNIPDKRIAITILPPLWRTWWAYLVYLVIAIIIFEAIRRTGLTMLRLRQKIAVEQQLTELKLSFFTNISHELRTPLTLILNPVDEILKGERLSEQGQEYFSIVRRNARRMARFVNQLLDLRKVQSKKAKLNTSFVELVSFVRELGEYFKELSREKHITFEVITGNEDVYAWIDAEKIETVLYNLLSNSYKFTPSGKKISVVIKQLAGDEVSIDVNDQGSGVLAEDLPHIFELYHEASHPQAKNLKGTGIGLALAKELVELHNGRINARNLPGGGLSVSVVLPANSQQIHESAHSPLEIPALPYINGEITKSVTADGENVQHHHEGVHTLLLVEDNPDMRAFLGRQLSALYRVSVADNGVTGLEKARKLQPDLILSDIMMPEMDGIEMLYHLKKEENTSHIPVVLLSAKNAIESQVKGLQYGADYYITKPFENEFLFAAVANILAKRKQFAQSMLSDKKTIDLSPGEIVVTSKDEIFLKQVITVIEERMNDPEFTIETVADIINMSRATFFRKFKALTQLAPVEFVRDMRLQRAKQYFDRDGGNVTEVAYEVGFSSAKYFSTCFKAKYDMSPSDYLKTVKI